MARRVFISFYHKDKKYRDKLINLNEFYKEKIFTDKSVGEDDISDDLTDEQIRVKIRDEYLQDSTVTVVLVGRCTRHRKHIDWEIGSSVIDGINNKRSGIIVIYLPETGETDIVVPSEKIMKEIDKIRFVNWSYFDKSKIFTTHPLLPERIQRNIKNNNVNIPILMWNDIIKNPKILYEAIEYSISTKDSQRWDTSIPFRKNNGNCKYDYPEYYSYI